MKRKSNSIEVHTLSQIQCFHEHVREATRLTREKLDTLITDPFEALHTLRFEKFGYHPLGLHPLNLIEQLNQSFTVMVSLAAARHLLEWFPQSEGLRLNPAAKRGRDIQSIRPNEVEAEVFAAVNPNNNGKLKNDIKSMTQSCAANRYVFFYAPTHNPGRQRDLEQPGSEVQVWALGRQEIMYIFEGAGLLGLVHV